MANRVSTNGKSVPEAQAEQVLALVESGVPLSDAEDTVGTTLAQLRMRGGLSARTKRLLDNAANADLLNEQNQRAMARARLAELALQDEDLKVSLGASRALAGTDQVVNALQINNQLPTDPAILDALKSLKLVVDELKGDEKNGTDGNV